MATFVLVHSPLVGPLTWSRAAAALRRRGVGAAVPTLRQDQPEDATPQPYWRLHAAAPARALRRVPPGEPILLVGHSGAGPLLPAIRHLARRAVAAYLFVDAGIPEDGQPRLSAGPFGDQLRAMYARGERFPNWTEADLAAVIPSPGLRRRLLAELRPQPLAFWEEAIPVSPGWPDAPGAYLQFSAVYHPEAARARARGWPCRELAGGHFHMLVDPAAVAEALLDLAGRLGIALPQPPLPRRTVTAGLAPARPGR